MWKTILGKHCEGNKKEKHIENKEEKDLRTPGPSNRWDLANGGASGKRGKPRAMIQSMGPSQRWATILHLGTGLNNVSLGPGVAVGEIQSESPSKTRLVDEVVLAVQAQA